MVNDTRYKYWFEDINELLDINKMNIYLPNKEMTYPEKVNSLVRLSWYIGILASLFTTNYLYLYIPMLTMIITYILYLFRYQEVQAEFKRNNANVPMVENKIDAKIIENLAKFQDVNGLVTKPSLNNPFMNPLPFDDRLRPPAAQILTNDTNKTAVETAFDKGSIRDVNDVWDKNNSKRQFFTMPWTSFPNDQGSFADWLYKTPPTCKEGNGMQCVANYHSDLTRRVEGAYH